MRTPSDPLGAQAYEELLGGASHCDALSIEETATALWHQFKGNLDLVAKSRMLRVVWVPYMPPLVPAMLCGNEVFVAHGMRATRTRVALAHELAHHILGPGAAHADVWALTLAILAPAPLVRSTLPGVDMLARVAVIPRWGAEVRLEIAACLKIVARVA